jgi:hypothetical protein
MTITINRWVGVAAILLIGISVGFSVSNVTAPSAKGDAEATASYLSPYERVQKKMLRTLQQINHVFGSREKYVGGGESLMEVIRDMRDIQHETCRAVGGSISAC